jgi:hypothetical protein
MWLHNAYDGQWLRCDVTNSAVRLARFQGHTKKASSKTYTCQKTRWHVAGNVGYCPILRLSAIRHLRPPHIYSINRSQAKLTDTVNISHKAPDSQSHAYWNAVYWAATDLVVTACVKKVWLPARTLNSWKHKSACTLDAIYFTSMTTGHNGFSVIQ